MERTERLVFWTPFKMVRRTGDPFIDLGLPKWERDSTINQPIPIIIIVEIIILVLINCFQNTI